MKHGYGNIGAVPVPGTAEVRMLPGYRCMRTPGVPNFSQKKKILGTDQVRVGYGSSTDRVRVRAECSQTASFLEKKFETYIRLSRSIFISPPKPTTFSRKVTVPPQIFHFSSN